MIHLVRHPVIAKLAVAVRRHIEHVANAAVSFENHHLRGAFDDVERFRLGMMLVRPHIGFAVMHDQHFM